MGLEVDRLFVGAGCNRIVNNVSWGPLGLVSFGAHNSVAIFSPETSQIRWTLPGHKAAVNCTHWLPSKKDTFKVPNAERLYLLTGGADGIIILWELTIKEMKWRQVLQIPEAHKKGVTYITGILVSQDRAVFASTSSDCSVLIWEIGFPRNAEGECILSRLDSLSVGPKPMVTLSLSELPGNSGLMVLAMGGLDHKIHLYGQDETHKHFILICQLKGHTEWVRSLDFSYPIDSDSGSGTLFLVSSSQDKSIRIWRMALLSSSGNVASFRREMIGLTSYVEGPVFSIASSTYQVSLESLLIGHEDWVYTVEWHPPLPECNSKSKFYQPLSILSASMDKTMMIWRPEKTTGIWVNMITVGELSHCALGFYGGLWSPSGNSILAHGYGGAFHMWKNIGDDNENWQPQNVPSGHFAAVSDIAWSRSSDYLLSVSHDQTTRAFAPWSSVNSVDVNGWHEIARPQVHGHDINCLAIVRGKGNHRFVSGGDEKVLRVFEAPLSFLRTLKHAKSQESSGPEDLPEEVHVLGANMSALGLSQKPIYDNTTSNGGISGDRSDASDSLEYIPDAVPTVLTKPPVEEKLAWHTLWPESHKLYGHGNELFSLCCDHRGELVASSCKAQSASAAEIWLWKVGSWKAVGRLPSHNLTVTQMEFSHDDNLLVAVSRDRQFSVFSISISDAGEVIHRLIARLEAHKRIIWSCSWNPFSYEFATGSRDKAVKIWGVDISTPSVKLLHSLPLFRSSVTALSWLGQERTQNAGLLAIGMESGCIELWSLRGGMLVGDDAQVPSKYSSAPVMRLDPLLCHTSTVHRLAWRELDGEDLKMTQLASCGADNCIRVFEVRW